MKKKTSIILIMALIVFAFVPALTLAQDETEQDSEVTEEDTEETYQNLEELLADLETNEDLDNIEKMALRRKLADYDENLNIESISSVVDKIVADEIELGQGFVILSNLEKSVNNGYDQEKALELINSYQDQDDSGHFAFQTALELRKLSREDLSEEKSAEFAEEIASIIETDGENKTSELKQLSAEYRKEAREEKREEMKADRGNKSNSASEKSLEKDKANNGSENAVNKDNNGKGNSKSSKAENNGQNKSSNKSSNSNSKANK